MLDYLSTPPGRIALAATATAMILGTAVTGCGLDGGAGGDAGEPMPPEVRAYFDRPCPPAAPMPAGAGHELSYWSMWTEDEPQGRVLRHAFDCFTAKTGVRVDVQWLGRKYLTQNLAPALNAGRVPDLFDQDINQVRAAIVSAGGTQAVDDVLARGIGEGAKTVADVIPRAYYDFPLNRDASGGLVQIPYEVLANAWWYDRKRLPTLTRPTSVDQLFGLFDRARRAGRGAVAQDGDVNLYNSFFFSQLAARYVGPGGLAAAAQDRTGLRWRTEPGFLQAARYVERLARGGYLLDGWDASKFPQLQQRWADGEADFLFVGSWGPSETREYLTKQGGGASIAYGSFQFPSPPGATHDVVERMPVGFSIPRQAPHATAAKAFIAYFLHRDLLAGIPTVANNLTPRPDLAVPADIAGVKKALDDPRKEHMLFMDGLHGLFGGTYVDEVFFPADNDLLRGRITARGFIDRMVSDTAAYWKARS